MALRHKQWLTYTHIAERSRLMFFKLHRDGTVGNRFVAREKAGFEQLNARAYTINIPPRPFLPFIGDRLQDGVEAEIIETLRRFLGKLVD